jgi:hypothetical protein
MQDKNKARRTWWSWGVGLSLLGALLTLGAWLWPRTPGFLPSPPKPGIYAVRVQVLDPQGSPIGGSRVLVSAGNEPHLLPDGWWQVEIPAAKVPANGLVSLWAEHKDWEGTKVDLRMGEDPNPRVEIRLKVPETWLRGRVVDGKDRALPGVLVSRQDGAPGKGITDAEGRFELKLAVPRETLVRLRADRSGSAPGDDFCYAGRDNCTIILEKR